MSDPLGLIGASGGSPLQSKPPKANIAPKEGPDFAQVLRSQLGEVNKVQQDATKALEDLMTGNRDDVEGVILATEKADTAFRMLQSMRNKVMDAYEEVKQIRV